MTAPRTYMVPAVLVTVLCFLPTGIAAIVFAAQAGSRTSVGDFQGAAEASRKARILVYTSVGIGVLFWLFVIIGAASGSSTS
ncbi:CD225/dispanin family protein [Streptomyces sp. NPDC047081]|uniref:CD225/dispanin family protein n=1 Tax=Streptomyces sp. NPDC047081 TaxID=3154706 RepID=UPI0033DB3CCA